VFIVSFGMACHAPPPLEVLEYMIRLGGGTELQRWEIRAFNEPKDEGPVYIDQPACYVLLGDSGAGFGQGIEWFSEDSEERPDLPTYDQRPTQAKEPPNIHMRVSLSVRATLKNPPVAPHGRHPVEREAQLVH
jgi:hypothetical protein